MGLNETEAIVLRTYNLAEADKIVVCLTKDFGVIRAVARGARRLKSRFGAGLEPLTVLSLSYFEIEGRELVSLRHLEIIRSHFNLARNTEVVASLAYISELVMEFSPLGEPNEKVFRMVRAVLEALEGLPEELFGIVRYFEIWILKLSGFYPELRVCVECSRNLMSNSLELSVSDRGLCCDLCSCRTERKISRAAYRQILRSRTMSPSEFAMAIKELTTTQKSEIEMFIQTFIGRALERKPHSQDSSYLKLK
jgi:DNA repair protein RecO (recombination protein O)